MQVTVFIKACKDQIDVLKNSITDEETNSKRWLGIRSDNLNADTIAHKHGVVWLLYPSIVILLSTYVAVAIMTSVCIICIFNSAVQYYVEPSF